MYQQDLAAGQSDPKAKAWYQEQVLEMYRKAAELGNEEATKMAEKKRSTLIGLLGVCLVFAWSPSAAVGGDPGEAARAGGRCRTGAQGISELGGAILRKVARRAAALVITVVGDGEKADKRARNPFGNFVSRYISSVSANGAVSGMSISEFGARGGGGGTIAPAEFKRLKELLTKLPDDGSRLPPAGRRMLIQAAGGPRADSEGVRPREPARRDPGSPPPQRVAHRCLAADVRAQKQDRRLRPFEHGGFLCLSPDKKQIIFTGHDKLEFWDPTTHETLGEVRMRGVRLDAIAFSPDGSLAAVSGVGQCAVVETKTRKQVQKIEDPMKWLGLSDPRFTPDGRYLLVQCGESWWCLKSRCRSLETHSWKRVSRLPDAPDGALQYIPAPKKRRAVIRSKNSVLSLWDMDRHAVVAELGRDGFASHVVFSPDESLVAVVTGYWEYSKPRGGTFWPWRTDTGEFVHELRPYERAGLEWVRRVIWSPDGRYVLAGTKGRSFGDEEGISVWNAKTGRHRGEFVGCVGHVNGIEFLPDGSELVAGCTDGTIRFWDFASAMRRIRDFENSPPPPGRSARDNKNASPNK